ncbi:MAG: sulfatase-like hydrolase/transferase [Pseudomonadota bacterium]|jgi:choline-sulfatase
MRQNVIVIMSDEHDPRHSGCYGSQFVKTPHIDALAARGVRFSSAYTPSPICVPARAAFATGMRVHQARLWDNALPYHGQIRGWGHVLQEHGIQVESVGKLHYRAEGDPVGFDKEHLPMHVVGGHGMVWASIRDPYLLRFAGQRMLGEKIGRGESSYTQYDEEVTRTAVDWLHAQSGRAEPFVLYVGLVAPHFPLIAPPQFYDLYADMPIPPVKLHPQDGHQRHPWIQAYADFEQVEESFKSPEERAQAFRAYYGLCSFLDHNVGQILQALQASGLQDNTTVVYTADHGDNLGSRGLWGKSTLYEESARVPMIVAGPGIAPGICETPVDLLDLFPTILESVGLDPAPEMQARPGQSLRQLAQAPVQADRVILSEYHAAGSNTAAFMLRRGRYKLIHYVRHAPELFDLALDPEELRDLASDPAHAAVLQAMQAALRDICDPEAMDALAKQDQQAMIDRMGGIEVASGMGAAGATPAPTARTGAA